MGDATLANLDRCKHLLAECTRAEDAKDIADVAEAARLYAKRKGAGVEVYNRAAEYRLRAERKLGEILKESPKAKGAASKRGSAEVPRLEDIGITKKESSRAQALASMPERAFEDAVTPLNGDEIVPSEVEARARGRVHVANNSGENEWYTPPAIIGAARSAMGSIDLDPASSDRANEFVEATKYYTMEDDGLAVPWGGNVWLNPPYAQPLIAEFAEKALSERPDQMCVLVNNATETAWFQRLAKSCACLCLLSGRVKFLDASGEPKRTPLQGQAVIYFGIRREHFRGAFTELGIILER